MRARRVALTAVKVVAAAADSVLRPAPGVVVLIYHRVGGASRSEIDLPDAMFDHQMAALAASGRVVSLEAALAALAPGAAVSRQASPVVVTFDDGTADFAERALPVLVRHRVPATLYLATDFVVRQVNFPDNGVPLSWAALRDCVSTGVVSVGSHTHTHALLDRLPPDEVADELDRSQQLIQDNLGQPAADFAYPKAVAGSADADAAVRSRFRSAALGGNRANAFGVTDVHRLARTAIQVSDGERWFHRKVAGGLALEDTFRRAINRRRYARAGT